MALKIPGPRTEMDRLAQAYRVRQAALSAQTALKVGRYWKGVEVGNEESERNFVELSMAAISSGFGQTAFESAAMVREQLGVEPDEVVPNVEQMARSLTYVGPIQARRAMRAGEGFEETFAEVTPAQAREQVAKRVRGSAVRLTALGGRETVRSAVDGKRVSYVRVTGYDPCAFCAMLASRRAVFSADSFDESDARFEGWGRVKVHDSCVVGSTVVSGPAVEARTGRRYEGPLVIVRTASGKNLSITPNHPVLTRDGWIPAGLLREGDEVVGGAGVEGALGGVPEQHKRPSRIEDDFASALVVRSALSVPGAAQQFHGDGAEGEVHVVSVDGLLHGEVDPSLFQPRRQLALTGARASGPATLLSGLCLEHHLAIASGATDARLMGGSNQGFAPLGVEVLPADLLRLGVGAQVHSGFGQAVTDDAARDSEALGEGLLGLTGSVPSHDLVDRKIGSARPRFDPASLEFAGEDRAGYAALGLDLRTRLAGHVELDRVVETSRVSFAGHVYNLQTSEGWYSANDIIVSNCQCSLWPITTLSADRLTQVDYFERLWKDLSMKAPQEGDTPAMTFRRNYDALRRAA